MEEHFDAKQLVKSTLYTLLEAFKAIGGAATVISGKLIKVSGYGVNYGGKVCAYKKWALKCSKIKIKIVLSMYYF